MSELPQQLERSLERPALLSLAVPLAIVGLLAIVLMPIPTWLMDMLICANLALSLVVMLTVLGVDKPSELTLFPSILLGLTLYRVALNIATTRLILTAAARDVNDPAEIAGQTIAAFGKLVAGGDLVTGVVIFGIITIVQFVVITRGASRIGEVAARFALDALPGRQLAIDADLRSGAISAGDARQRRDTLNKEADFFAGLDGVGKFLRGDVLAGLLIVFINAAGGLYVGLVRLGWPVDETLDTFTILTIGDGLATQIPALLCSVSAGLLVTRGSGTVQFVPALRAQFLRRPGVLAMAALLVAILAFTSLPSVPLLLLTAGLAVLSWRFHVAIRRHEAKKAGLMPVGDRPTALPTTGVPAVEVRLGNELRGLAQGVLDGVGTVRQAVADTLGLPLSPVTVGDDSALPPTGYRLLLRGEPVCEGLVFPGCLLVPVVSGWSGAVCDPYTSAPGRWETESEMVGESAHPTDTGDKSGTPDTPSLFGGEPCGAGYRPVEVVLRHLYRMVQDHADELLSREIMSDLMERLSREHPRLMDEAISRNLSVTVLQRIGQQLLREEVPIRDLAAIVEAAGEIEEKQRPAGDWTERLAAVRVALRRTLVRPYLDDDQVLRVLTVGPEARNCDVGELAGGVRRQWPGYPATRPVLWLEPQDRLAVWQALYQTGLRTVCLCPAECPPGQRVVNVGKLVLP